MNKIVRNVLLILFPFLVLVLVNEFCRPNINNQSHKFSGVSTINNSACLSKKCSWVCHDNTSYCKKHHVKYLKSYLATTDPFYHGVINSLESSGNYVVANIIFLVFLFPLSIMYFLIRSINIQEDIIQLSKKQ